MGKLKFDGVIDAVHYAPDGMVDWVRLYERRGPTFSDHVLLPRLTLIERLKSGKRFVTGKRQIFLASTFVTSQVLQLIQHDGQDYLSLNGQDAERDQLPKLPAI
jgi:hypothetical protein